MIISTDGLPPTAAEAGPEPFRHEAFFYSTPAGYLARTSSFVREGLDAGEPVLVAVVPEKISLLQSALGADAERVLFANMAEVGRNPARIIPLWREFLDGHGGRGRSVRGIGEPIWAARTADELVESQRHEALLNLAFSGDPAWILCPYDTVSLGRSVLEEAHRSHPLVSFGGEAEISKTCLDPSGWAAPFDVPLHAPPEKAERIPIAGGNLSYVRSVIHREAIRSGLSESRADDLVVAVNEVATNSIRHGGGRGTLRVWNEGSSLVCEVSNETPISKPLAGRVRPQAGEEGGFGLWLVNQICDLVQIRTFPTGSVFRLYMTPH